MRPARQDLRRAARRLKTRCTPLILEAATRKEGIMAKVLTITAFRSTSDPKALKRYAELAGPAITSAGGRIIARGKPLAVVEEGVNERVAVIEWDGLEQAQAFYKTPAYQAALEQLAGTAVRDIRIVEAVA
jgi:uncharacterized protein (DUF1330 family)